MNDNNGVAGRIGSVAGSAEPAQSATEKAVEAIAPEITDPLEALRNQTREGVNGLLERWCGAYLRTTNLPPQDVQLRVMAIPGGVSCRFVANEPATALWCIIGMRKVNDEVNADVLTVCAPHTSAEAAKAIAQTIEEQIDGIDMAIPVMAPFGGFPQDLPEVPVLSPDIEVPCDHDVVWLESQNLSEDDRFVHFDRALAHGETMRKLGYEQGVAAAKKIVERWA